MGQVLVLKLISPVLMNSQFKLSLHFVTFFSIFNLSIYLIFYHLPVYLSINLSSYLHKLFTYIYLIMYLFICLLMYLSIYLSICLSSNKVCIAAWYVHELWNLYSASKTASPILEAQDQVNKMLLLINKRCFK